MQASADEGPRLDVADLFRIGMDATDKLTRGVRPRPAGFPPGPPGDISMDLLQDPLRFLEKTSATYGGSVGMVLAGEYVVLLSDPALVRQVVIDEADTFVKAGTAFFPGSALAGNGLLVSDGGEWRRQRRLSNPAFRRSAIQEYSQFMTTETERWMAQEWGAGGTRDTYADFNQLTLDIVLQTLFGSSLSPTQGRQVSEAIKTAFGFFTERSGTGFAIPEWVPTPTNVQYTQAVKRLDTVIYDIIDERRRAQRTADSDEAPKDLLQGMLSATDTDGSAMSDKALRDELMTFLVAGQETSAILLGWTSAFLAAKPWVQQAARKEVDAALAGRTPTAADFASLRYVTAVVCESMRLRPPAFMVGRCANRTATLGPATVERGTTVLVAPYLLHRDRRHWKDPERFYPERWLEWLGEGNNAMALMSGLGPNGVYMPFGGGPRNCIGTGFALTEVVLVLAQILQKWELKAPPLGPSFPKAAPLITLRPEKVPLRVVPRQGAP